MIPAAGFGGSTGALRALVMTGSIRWCEPEIAQRNQKQNSHRATCRNDGRALKQGALLANAIRLSLSLPHAFLRRAEQLTLETGCPAPQLL